jgi:hypothetical protein
MNKNEDDDEFMDYLIELANQSRYAGFFEGLTRSRTHRGNKQDKELAVARHVFPNAASFQPGADPPDVEAITEQGKIGIEVSELVDREVVEQHARRRHTEHKSGLTTQGAMDADDRAHQAAQAAARIARQNGNDPLEAYVKAYEANRPTPGHTPRMQSPTGTPTRSQKNSTGSSGRRTPSSKAVSLGMTWYV